MGTPLNLQSLSDEGLAVRLPDGKWALTPQGIGGHVLDGPLTALRPIRGSLRSGGADRLARDGAAPDVVRVRRQRLRVSRAPDHDRRNR
jgi:hypothetical protein